MKEYKIRQYQKEDYTVWNAFISVAKNATFLFHRDFMEYHANRFKDASLLVFDEEELVAVLPANGVENTIFSHQGLTYGGLVLGPKAKLSSVIGIFKDVLLHLHQNQITKLQIKTIPGFYCNYFSEELDYCMFLLNAKTIRQDALSVIDLTQPFFITKTRRESINRGKKNNLIIKEEPNFELFWNEILMPNLERRYHAKPVHSCEEIIQLYEHFPKNIRHFNVYFEGKIVAGSTVFVTENVAHPQYISANENRNELGCIDFLYHHLIHEVFSDKKFFDFGPSHEDNGRKINEGILFWKESFGAKTTTQPFYEVNTSNYNLLNTVLL